MICFVETWDGEKGSLSSEEFWKGTENYNWKLFAQFQNIVAHGKIGDVALDIYGSRIRNFFQRCHDILHITLRTKNGIQLLLAWFELCSCKDWEPDVQLVKDMLAFYGINMSRPFGHFHVVYAVDKFKFFK